MCLCANIIHHWPCISIPSLPYYWVWLHLASCCSMQTCMLVWLLQPTILSTVEVSSPWLSCRESTDTLQPLNRWQTVLTDEMQLNDILLHFYVVTIPLLLDRKTEELHARSFLYLYPKNFKFLPNIAISPTATFNSLNACYPQGVYGHPSKGCSYTPQHPGIASPDPQHCLKMQRVKEKKEHHEIYNQFICL